jgi:PIN domain nuclease of toxin-antitoxin system
MARPITQWLPSKMHESGFFALALTHEHALAAAELPRYHEDPFDRMLIAQARVEDLRILTADAQFERYDVRLIDATA